VTPTGADFCTGKGLWGADGGTWLDRRGADGVEVVPYRDGSSFCFLFLPIPTNEPDTLVGEIDERSRVDQVPPAAPVRGPAANSRSPTSWANGAFLSSNLQVPVRFRYNISVSQWEFCMILSSDSEFSRIRNCTIEFTQKSCMVATCAQIIVGTT
jgi:hypothetical protein